MILRSAVAIIALALCWGVPRMAHAADPAPCSPGLVCASKPQTIVDALLAAGYKARLTKDGEGDPKIESAANGYDFSIFFYDCQQGRNCASIQFQVSFADDGKNTPELANEWNRSKRFLQMSVGKDNGLRVCYDVTTVGGLNSKNFADVIDWWAGMMGQLNRFFKEQG